MSRVLVVDDDCGMRAALEARFLKRGWRVETAGNAAEAVEKFRRGLHSLVVTDIRMSGEDGFFVMRSVRRLAPNTPVILLTAYASVPDAVAAMKDGACDYLIKPVCFEQLEQAAERILSRAARESSSTKELAGHAPSWLKAIERARQAAASDADILIEAESGTGKELVARMIHQLSPRSEHPFIAVNCAAFPETLLESELFGHVKGAFTGAGNAKPGKFELANEGTLLLDEVGEMPLALQPKLLRVLQEREVDRLGDTRSLHVNLRVIATTNRPLIQMVRDGRFRADLYYRLNVIPLSLPPLRERPGDIPELAQFFAQLYAPPGRPAHLAPEFLQALDAHSWPGNVRELANCIHRSVALSTSPEVGLSALEDMDWLAGSPATSNVTCLQPGLSLEEMERKLFEMTLAATGGNRSRAAELLGVSLRTVRNKVRSYGLPGWSAYVHE
ncbi:MAG TPA: sigma-54 dependent transcriptional regulator [Candidatus Acidoferrales bacterium]|nr:sigma-54 dependent transcriptional regulator [Candidatus Acidoferrales bacterium]